jgi:ATP-dependent Clp protease ATP-binding subunit ClpA
MYEATPGLAKSVTDPITDAATPADEPGPSKLTQLPQLLRKVVDAPSGCALLVTNASRLAADGEATDGPFHEIMTMAEKLAETAVTRPLKGNHAAAVYNAVFWLVDKENDLPPWFAGLDRVRVVSVPQPSQSQRYQAAFLLMKSLPGGNEAPLEEREAAARQFADATGGLNLKALREINRLAIDRRIPFDRIDDAVRTYRVGVPDNPWQDADLRQKIRDGSEYLGKRVLGQPHAIRKSVDILIRSAMGLTGAQGSGETARPQGVLFFAGPTGVGKTELAKALAELVFGRRDAYTRFDMSEFASEYAESRLIGAPVGYSGHTAGGELTNAIRQQPFQLILFDEIEKAHPRILDKFLQILEDGRLTDGNGVTVHFTETLLVFTSNLGVYEIDDSGVRYPVVQRGAPYGEVETSIRNGVEEHFTSVIGRPELLNRLGDNIVVFNFISDETADQLVPLFMENVQQRVLASTGIRITFADAVVDHLQSHARTRLDYGGRGVSSVVESLLVNPLARALFDAPNGVAHAEVTAVEPTDDGWEVRLTRA